MPDNPAASALDGIRERANGPMRKFSDVDASQRDIARLIAAIEAALKLADEWDAPVPEYDDRMNVRQDCAVRLHEAITAALAGKEAGDE